MQQFPSAFEVAMFSLISLYFAWRRDAAVLSADADQDDGQMELPLAA